jgi:meiotically up-regulated gene 157 (Mug157) protein
MSVELGRISNIFKKLKKFEYITREAAANLAATTKELSESIADGIKRHAIFDHAIYGQVYAFEIDGYGGRIFMDDANLPSLLSFPLMGFLANSDPVYMNTRKMVLSRHGNPYFLSGREFEGIGGPHIGLRHAWPMSVIVQIMTSDDDAEILRCLDMLKKSTGGLGLMHESGNFHILYSPVLPVSFLRFCSLFSIPR